MPRHPPCALHSLSQQRQNNTHSNAANTRHSRQQPTPTTITIRGRPSHKRHDRTPRKEATQPHRIQLIKRIALDNTTPSQRETGVARCSRPLCRSQTTTPPTPTTPQRDLRRRRTRTTTQHQPNPDHSRTGWPADSSGPNSVLDPIPHQREAMSNHHSHPASWDKSVIVDDSTSETPPCASEHSPLIWVRAP
jgi:hypothetical protein